MTAATAAKQPLPAASHSHSQGIPPRGRLPQEDQSLLQELSARIRAAEDPKEDVFHEAVEELHEYILGLRARLDAGFTEPDPSDVRNTWKKAEPTRPSVKRVQNLAYNFFESPGIRTTSLGIHVQKLQAALPHFRRVIAYSLPPSDSLSEHFSEVTKLMASSLLLNLDKARLEQYLILGLIMGYRTTGMRWPFDSALRHFAGQGVETFVEQLERVVRGAIHDGADPQQRVTAELLDKDGTMYRLMRIAFDRVNDAVADIEGRSIEEARRILAENDYSTGACPAIFPIDSVVDPQTRAKRPIAYEYAMTILRHTPPRLLLPA